MSKKKIEMTIHFLEVVGIKSKLSFYFFSEKNSISSSPAINKTFPNYLFT